MSPEREKEIQDKAIGVMSRLLPRGQMELDLSRPFQAMSSVGLSQCLASIPKSELIEALQKLDGFRHVDGEFQIPSKYFIGK